LSPDDVNGLATDIVKTFQGDGSTVRDLIARTASLTSTLADHDELIGQVVGNLNTTVGLVSERHGQLEDLIAQLSDYAAGMARDRHAIGDALGHIDSMTELSAGLLKDNRPALKADIGHLRGVAETLNKPENTRLVEHALEHLPDKLARLTRTASYGSWFNYFVCSVQVRVGAGAQDIDPALASVLNKIKLVDSSKRCAS
jgi:phospholipid/cholesterol/gamma-HCH transport system substrate-binding protein